MWRPPCGLSLRQGVPVRLQLPRRPASRLVLVPVLAVVLGGCGGSDAGPSSDEPTGYLSGEGPGWYDGVRYLSLAESKGRLTGFLSAVVPDSAEGAVRVRYTLDGFADGDTFTLTATADPGNVDTYLGGSGTWLGQQDGESLVLTLPAFELEDEFRPAMEEEFNRAAAQATTVAMQQRDVWAANDATAGTLEEIYILGERLAAVSFADLLAEYDTNLAQARYAVAKVDSTDDCYYGWVVEYELDAIADLDSRRLAADAATVAADAEALAAAQARARGEHDALEQAVAVLPDGVETTPSATVSADQVEVAVDAADQQSQQALTAVGAAEDHAAVVRGAAQSLAAEVAAAGC